MNVLAIVRSEKEMKGLADYAGKVTSIGDELHLINIIHTHGEIPTSTEGIVLDGCTEFDLTPYFNEKAENEQWMRSTFDSEIPTQRKVFIGDRDMILGKYVAKYKIDLIITVSEHSSEALDLIRRTKAVRLKQHLALPILAIKCEKGKEPVKNIAIVSDFSDPKGFNMLIPRHIIEVEGARFTLYTFCQDSSEFKAAEQRMEAFIEHHGLGNANSVVIEAKNKEKSAQDLLMQYPIQLMVIMDFKRTGLRKILKGDLESDMLNHTLVPILAL